MIARFYVRIAEGYPDLTAAWGIKKLAALFIATLILRHPDVEEDTHEMHRHMVQMYEAAPKDADGRPLVSHILHDGKPLQLDASDYEEYKNADANRLKQMFAEQIARSQETSATSFSKSDGHFSARTNRFSSRQTNR